MMTSVESTDIESIMRWFENPIEGGENGILVYPNLQTFRGICTQYVKDQLVVRQEEEQKEENEENNDDYYLDNNGLREELQMPRIILIATFYDTVNAVKHNLSAVDVNVQSRIDDGSLLIVDAFNGYHPDIDGVKKLVASLSERAAREGRIGVFSCYHVGDYKNLNDSQKKELQ